jgi:hypothetical protein
MEMSQALGSIPSIAKREKKIIFKGTNLENPPSTPFFQN